MDISDDRLFVHICRTVSPTKLHIPSYAVHVEQNSPDIVLFLMDASNLKPSQAIQLHDRMLSRQDCWRLKVETQKKNGICSEIFIKNTFSQ